MEKIVMPKNWNKETYKNFINYLISIKDDKYKEFHSSLVLGSKYEIIGIKMPIMRGIAKDIAKTNIEEFIKCSQDKYYEEIMIQGLVISHVKDEKLFYKYFKMHINKIDNWALCDTFCNSIKIIKKYEDKYFKEAVKMCLNKKTFISRTGIVMILSNFINENNIQAILNTMNKIKSDEFYINMAQAWLVCEMYIKYPKEIMPFIKENNLNSFTQNKAISKIRDSYRVSKEEKEYLNTFRRKL